MVVPFPPDRTYTLVIRRPNQALADLHATSFEDTAMFPLVQRV